MLSLAKEDNMAKLTDSQLITLSAAAARDDGVAVAPQGMGKAAAAKLGTSLVARKFMREIRSKRGMPIWREADKKNFSLVITRAGRKAIGVEDEAIAGDCSTRAAVNAAAKTQTATTAAQPEQHSIDAAPRLGSKQALIVDMLSKDDGASLDALIEATGWLPHTTRAALTGLRKRGYAVERVRDESTGSLYRIVKKLAAAIGL
jgi:DNA-binding MarR family transcriptional regulator